MTAHGPSYQVEVAASARRDVRRLPHKIAAAITEFITGPLAQNPYRLSKPLHRGLACYRAARRGDYRVLFRVDDNARVILIVAVNHRAHIYRRR